MKRLISAVAGIALVTACQDFNNPNAESPAAPSIEAVPEADSAQVQAAASAQIWAVVDMNGNLIHGNRTTGVVKLGPGQYEVSFNRNLTSCAYVATTRNAYSQAIQASTAGGHLSANGVYVETKNQGGGLTDGPFDLVVTCGGTGIRYAVVGYSADLVRSTSGTTLSFLGAGRYNIRFASPVTGCAFIATLADPGNALVFNPSGVYTGSGPDANTVYIETKNPGGGLQDGVPFHLALICSSTANTRYAVVRADRGQAAVVLGHDGHSALDRQLHNQQQQPRHQRLRHRGDPRLGLIRPCPSTRRPSKSCRARPTTRSRSRSGSCCSSAEH